MSLILTILNPSFIIGILILIPILWLFNCMNKKGGVNIDNFTSCLFKGGVNTICKMTIGQATGAKTCDVATDVMSSVVSTTTNFAKGFITRPVNLVKNLAKGNFEGAGEVLYNMNPAILSKTKHKMSIKLNFTQNLKIQIFQKKTESRR